jgi:hypothetical protein
MEWISVNDRLPEKSGDYLVTDSMAKMVAYFSYEHKEWDFFGLDFWKDADITHWMPLPPPPTVTK